MPRGLWVTGTLLLASSAAFGQAAATPSFEVASIKPATPPSPGGGQVRIGSGGGPGTSDPGQYTAHFASLRTLLTNAYGVKNYQISGPASLDSERFDIMAKVPAGATKDDLKLMLQGLLAERFKLTLHHETKEMAMYSLVVAKNGPKLKESVEGAVPDAPKGGGDTGFGAPLPPPPGGMAGGVMVSIVGGSVSGGGHGMPAPPPGSGPRTMMMMMPGRARLVAQQQTVAQLAAMLANQLDRPVTDMTGLTKKYDMTLEYAPDESRMNGPLGMLPPGPPPGPRPAGGAGEGPIANSPDDAPAANLFSAIQDQLGLKLESKKGPVDILVIDHVEKTPTEN